MKKTIFLLLLIHGILIQSSANNHINDARGSMGINSYYGHPLPFLYNSKVGNVFRHFLKQSFISKLAGHYCDLPISKVHIKPFIKAYTIDMSESEKQVGQFASFNDFFTRTLIPSARPINPDPKIIVAPCDGSVIVLENIKKFDFFPIKNATFNVGTFINNTKLARDYEGGTVLVFRIDPYDYHRFHFPIDCIPTQCLPIKGHYDSVNPIALSVTQPLHTNERKLITLKSNACGDILMVPVGAMCVGKIIATYTADHTYAKGDEAGYFCFGGSTVGLVFKKGTIAVDESIIKHSQDSKEIRIKMGQRVAHIVAS